MKVLKSLARLKAMRLEEDEEPGRRKEVAVEKVKIAGMHERNARGCIDSGTNMAVRQMKDEEKELDRKEKLKERDAELATGKKVRVKENEKGTIVTVEAVQPLLPYVRAREMLKLKMREDGETGKLWIEHPIKGRLEVYTENGTLEMDEDVVLQLIEELEDKHDQIGARGKDEGGNMEKEIEQLVREMMDRGWTIEELAERVGEHFQKSARKIDEEEETKHECKTEPLLRLRGGGPHERTTVDVKSQEEQMQKGYEEEEEQMNSKQRQRPMKQEAVGGEGRKEVQGKVQTGEDKKGKEKDRQELKSETARAKLIAVGEQQVEEETAENEDEDEDAWYQKKMEKQAKQKQKKERQKIKARSMPSNEDEEDKE